MTMRDKLLYGVAGALFGLSLIVLGASVYQTRASKNTEKTQSSALAVPLPKLSEQSKIDSALTSALYERPLFTPDRQPVKRAELVDLQEKTSKVSPLSVSLVGIITGNGKKLAVLKSSGGNEVVSLAEGELFDGWTIMDVYNDSVVLQKGGARQSLRLPEKE